MAKSIKSSIRKLKKINGIVKKKLAILGASYLQKPLVLKANLMGIETHCFAWDSDDSICKEVAKKFYPISVLDKEAILEKCREIKIDGILTIATDICVPTLSFVAEKLNLVGNSTRSSLMSTNKGKMKEAFLKNNVNTPVGKRIKEFNEVDFSDFRFPLIVKPADRSGSRGINKVNNTIELANCIEIALNESLQKEAIVEEFIDGAEVSVESISWKGNHFVLAITDKITTGQPHFVELEHHQPSQLPKEIQDKIMGQTIRALDALEIKYGAGHTEIKISSSGEIKVIEVGARMGGDFIGSHLVELSTQYDFLEAVIQVALNKFEIPKLNEFKFFSGIYFLSKETQNLMPYFKNGIKSEIEKKIFKEELQWLDNSNKRSGYLIYKSTKKVNLL